MSENRDNVLNKSVINWVERILEKIAKNIQK